MPERRRCLECGAKVVVYDLDEHAICRECLAARAEAESQLKRPDGQVGARFIGKQRGTFGDIGASKGRKKRP